MMPETPTPMDDEKEKSNKGPESEQIAVADWAELTQECLINILSRLSLEDRWRCAMRVCKAWHEACKDPCLNSVLDLEHYFDPASELPRFWTPDFERVIDNMLRSVVVWSSGYLTEIRVRHCSDRSISLVAKRCPNLQVLCIKSCPHLTDAVMSEIALGCTMLREVNLSYCYQVSHESLSLLGSHCPNLGVIKRNLMNWMDPSQHTGIVPSEYLNACPQDGDSEADAIARFMPNLVHIELRFTKLTAKGLAAISQGCQRLEHLDLSGCVNVTGRDIADASSNMKNLETIKKPNLYIPRSVYHAERYGHWRLYDERFQTDIFRI